MKVAVIIPAYKVKKQILDVVKSIPENVHSIYVVDDKCPEESGTYVEQSSDDSRVQVLYNTVNLGVGGAMKAGFSAAISDDIDIVVKIDGDGQMDPALINKFTTPIIKGSADYTKGNRFYSIYNVKSMPKVLLIGNAGLSFMTKVSSGYYKLFDPTNGYLAIHTNILKHINFDNISDRYFFESDMLINVGMIGACVKDIPMEALYADEKSNLKVSKVFGEFLFKNIKSTIKRVFYNYFLRDFNIASLQLIGSILLLSFGTIFGAVEWFHSAASQSPATSGSVMLSALPIILGVQMFGGFLFFDISRQPETPIYDLLDQE